MFKATLVAFAGLMFATYTGALAEDAERFPSAPLVQEAPTVVQIDPVIVSGFECAPFVFEYVKTHPGTDYAEELACCHASDVRNHGSSELAQREAALCQGVSWTTYLYGSYWSFCETEAHE